MRIVWLSDSPEAATGYGNVTRWVTQGLARRGHDVVIFGREIVKTRRWLPGETGWPGNPDAWSVGDARAWNGCTLYPFPPREEYVDAQGAVRQVADRSQRMLVSLIRDLRPDLLIMLTEIEIMASPDAVRRIRRELDVPWAFYFALGGDLGGGRLPAVWVESLNVIDLPIAMSRYGQELARANGVEAPYIPHGVDTRVFRPPEDKTAAKARLGYEHAFVILADARNHARKLLVRTLDIVRRFAAGKADVVLHLHCDPDDPLAAKPPGSYDIRADLALLGLTAMTRFTENMRIVTGGVPIETLASIYQAADVHLLTSFGEGFGLPTLQAASCGVVPLAPAHSANPELLDAHGEALPIRRHLCGERGVMFGLVDIDAAVERLETLYRQRHDLAARGRQARAFAETFDWDIVVDQWDALLRTEGTPERLAHRAAHRRPASTGAAIGTGPDREPQGYPVTIPVTLPPCEAGGTLRTTGCVYLASAHDIPVFLALRRLFPSLRWWSTPAMGAAADAIGCAGTLADSREDYARWMRASTLALDIHGTEAPLGIAAADYGVPCVAARPSLDASEDDLWTDLTVARGDVERAALLARAMLTDQAAAMDACESAGRRVWTRKMTSR